MTDAQSDPKVEIAHVLTMDVVGYSTLLINEQSRVLADLTRTVRETGRFRQAEADGKLLRLPTGDGMVLVFFTDPEAPIECAMEIGAALKNHPKIRLRMGIHSGPVNQVLDVNDRSNLAGAGIDIAQRVTDCGDAGHILLSKRFAEDLAPYSRWNPHLHDLGECEVKHGRKVSLVNFYTDEIGNPQQPKKCAAAKEKPPARSTRTFASSPGLARALIAAAALLILGAVIAVLFLWRQSPAKPTKAISSVPQPNAKSIAVLPFENLSHDPDNAYFADGIQEEILTRLSKIADLKVISRTSTQRYKSAPENLLEIARQLGVANILEGSVQKAADQVRVNVQLINAQNDSHLWADKFDRKLTDVFAVETEIAAKIADILQAKLTGAEQHAIAARPTESREAHEFYLKGRHFAGRRTGEDLRKAIDYFNQAIAKDPNYALAYAGIADSYTLLPQWSNETPAEYFLKARTAAGKALAIDDSLAEAHVSLALLLVNDDLNLRDAKRELQRAIELNPNYSAAHYFLGISVFAPLGQFDQAISEIKRAIELDPLSAIVNANLGYCYILARRYPEAIAELRKAAELDPSFPYIQGCLGEAFLVSGDLPAAIAQYEKANDRGRSLFFLFYAYALKGEREKAAQVLSRVKEIQQREGSKWAFGGALISLGLGDKQQAIDWLERSYRAKETGVIIYIKVDPLLDPLRGDPRFEKLVSQIIPPDAR